MPNLLPDWLPWIQPAGRLIWSTLLVVAGIVIVMVLMKPPLLKRPFSNGVAIGLYVIAPVIAYVVAILLPDDANLWDWEIDAILVNLVLLFWFVHTIALVASRTPKPAGYKATWAECYLGAVGAFALMALAYGVLPHEWMEFANGYLQWGDTGKFLFQSNQSMLFFPWNWPFNFDYPALRDIVVSGIYVVLLGLNLVIFVKWQDRKLVADEAPAAESNTPAKRSRFGRPLRKGGRVATAGEGA